MKLSKFIALSQKAIDKYGDIDLGVFSSCDSDEICDGSEAYQNLSLRVICDQWLPGESLEEEEQPDPPVYHAILFYD